MLSDFSLIALFILLVLGFATSLILIPQALKKVNIVPSKPSWIKSQPYECGLETVGESWVQFKIRYYFYALLLISLDITIIFIYPWAAELKNLGSSSLGVILPFLGILATGYIYAWRKGALEWK